MRVPYSSLREQFADSEPILRDIKGLLESTQYTLGQLSGTLSIVPAARAGAGELAAFTARVARANGWTRSPLHASRYPPFRHVGA